MPTLTQKSKQETNDNNKAFNISVNNSFKSTLGPQLPL